MWSIKIYSGLAEGPTPMTRQFSPPFDASLCTRSAHAVATFTRLKSGLCRVRGRQKEKNVNDTFLRRKDAEEWEREIERRIDPGEPPLALSTPPLRSRHAHSLP